MHLLVSLPHLISLMRGHGLFKTELSVLLHRIYYFHFSDLILHDFV